MGRSFYRALMFFALPMVSFAAVSYAPLFFTNDLSLGAHTPDVTALQQCLAKDPALYPEGIVSGYFGALTQKAVQRFQEKNAIVSSGTPFTTGFGRMGPKTRGKLNAFCDAQPPHPAASEAKTQPAPIAPAIQPPAPVRQKSASSAPDALSPEQKQALLDAWNKLNVDAPLGAEGPGGCATIRQCTDYCASPYHYVECFSFVK
ncbi:MAG: peptidoglycan-binding protein [Patescibacteria group bacterium]|nr:peptidoglycan-binding protein [Patescibacteria group bacterium]